METYLHTCSNCGDEKEIVLKENETPEDLNGCVCDRTVDKVMFSAEDLMRNISKEK